MNWNMIEIATYVGMQKFRSRQSKQQAVPLKRRKNNSAREILLLLGGRWGMRGTIVSTVGDW